MSNEKHKNKTIARIEFSPYLKINALRRGGLITPPTKHTHTHTHTTHTPHTHTNTQQYRKTILNY